MWPCGHPPSSPVGRTHLDAGFVEKSELLSLLLLQFPDPSPAVLGNPMATANCSARQLALRSSAKRRSVQQTELEARSLLVASRRYADAQGAFILMRSTGSCTVLSELQECVSHWATLIWRRHSAACLAAQSHWRLDSLDFAVGEVGARSASAHAACRASLPETLSLCEMMWRSFDPEDKEREDETPTNGLSRPLLPLPPRPHPWRCAILDTARFTIPEIPLGSNGDPGRVVLGPHSAASKHVPAFISSSAGCLGLAPGSPLSRTRLTPISRENRHHPVRTEVTMEHAPALRARCRKWWWMSGVRAHESYFAPWRPKQLQWDARADTTRTRRSEDPVHDARIAAVFHCFHSVSLP